MSQAVEIPQTSKGKPASIAPDQFPFHFPKSPRRLGGTFSVEETTRRLKRLAVFHHMLMRTLAGWVIEIPEFEVKIELGHHIYQHAEACRGLRQRLIELRVPPGSSDEFKDEQVALLQKEIEQSHNAPELIVATQKVTSYLLQAEVQLEKETDGLVDLPTIRLLRQIKPDLVEISAWGEAVVRAYVDGGWQEQDLIDWGKHVEAVLHYCGGVFGDLHDCARPLLRQDVEPPFQRKINCARDERFTTFHHTRDYRHADELNHHETGEYERERLELIRVQRDEIDAIETFANVLYDLPSAPFDLQFDLARFIWDEARHAEMGQQSLAQLGFDPYDVPCGIIGINVRAPLPPELALAQISIFGELNMVGRLRRLAQWAYQSKDRPTGIGFDFIHADELIHLRRGRAWLKTLRNSDDLTALQKETRAVAIRRLLEEGVIGEDYAMNLTAKEIGELIGE
jgi:hypothetical protein